MFLVYYRGRLCAPLANTNDSPHDTSFGVIKCGGYGVRVWEHEHIKKM